MGSIAMNSFEETSCPVILDLSDSCYLASNTSIYNEVSTNFNTSTLVTLSDEDAWNILKMEENLDWILSQDHQSQNIPFPSHTPYAFDTKTGTSPPSLIFSEPEIGSSHESISESSEFENNTEPTNDGDWIASCISNLPQKSRLISDSDDSETESSSGSNSDESEWVLKNEPKKNRHSSKKLKQKKPNVSHWLWELLQSPKNHKMIQFTDEKIGEFRIVDQKKLAYIWGSRNGRTNLRMNYKDLARTMRYHYKKSKGQELQAVNRHLVYRFSRHFLNARRNENVQ